MGGTGPPGPLVPAPMFYDELLLTISLLTQNDGTAPFVGVIEHEIIEKLRLRKIMIKMWLLCQVVHYYKQQQLEQQEIRNIIMVYQV